MSEVIVTVKYGEGKRIDLALPYEVPGQELAQAVADALKLDAVPGQTFSLSLRDGKEMRKIAPTETLADARVVYASVLVLSQSGSAAARTTSSLRLEAYVKFENGDVFLLNATATKIGRWAPGVEIDINLTQADPKKLVSRRHATIEQRGGKFALVDDRSNNGTLLNGRRIPPLEPQPLSNGDVIQFGGPMGPRVTFILKS